MLNFRVNYLKISRVIFFNDLLKTNLILYIVKRSFLENQMQMAHKFMLFASKAFY